MTPLPDFLGYDLLVDELASQDPWERQYPRPSNFPSARALITAVGHPVAAPPDPAATRSAIHVETAAEQPESGEDETLPSSPARGFSLDGGSGD